MCGRCTPNIMSVQCSFMFTSNSRKINPSVNSQNSSTTGHIFSVRETKEHQLIRHLKFHCQTHAKRLWIAAWTTLYSNTLFGASPISLHTSL